MNKCIICGKEFEPSKDFPERKTCSKGCLKIHMRNSTSEKFLQNSFKTGDIPYNKGKSQSEWMSKKGIEACKKTYIQYQPNSISEFAFEEGRFLPKNTYQKGTVTKRKHIHRKGKAKGKVEWEYYINIDWRGNRKPNNLFRRYLWELYHQQDVPKGYVVYNKTQNDNNIRIENLVLISRADLARLNRWGTKYV